MAATTKSKPLTKYLPQLIANVRKLAAQYPDAVYKPPGCGTEFEGLCQYNKGTVLNGPPNKCGCIVGIAAGMIHGSLKLQLARRGDMIKTIFDAWSFASNKPLTDKQWQQVSWLEVVQEAQDRRNSWHVAVSRADALRPVNSTKKV